VRVGARGTDRQLNRILFLFATGRQEIIFDVKIFLTLRLDIN
jgi:hypothetical protein